MSDDALEQLFGDDEIELRDEDIIFLIKAVRRANAEEDMRAKVEADRANMNEVRARCAGSFAEFVRAAWPIVEPETELIWGWHMDAICQHLEAISRGQMYPRLIINVPPGSSKSLLVSVLWQAWEWGPLKRLGLKYLSTSFEFGNVKRDTRKTRDLMMSEWYQMLWPEVQFTRTGEASFANSRTGTREGAAFSSITAKRGDRFIIDDPHSVDGAESEVERTRATRRFLEGGLNRLNSQSKSAIVVVMQRLHQDDLTGVLLARELGFEHLLIPMEYEPDRAHETSIGWSDPRTQAGELMDPARVPRAEADMLKNVSAYSWAGQYQQRPAPREGGMFKVGKIEIIDISPGGGRAVRGWDFASSKGEKSPWSVGLKLRQIPGALIVEDVRRGRWSPFELEAQLLACASGDGLDVVQSCPQDPGQAGVAQKRHIAEKLHGKNFRFSPEQGAKEQRAIPIAAQVEAGVVKFVRAPWNDTLKDEMENFPNGSFKDQVDALSRAYAELLGKGKVEDNARPITATQAHDPESPQESRPVRYNPLQPSPYGY